MLNITLYLLQRVSAAMMVPFVLVHLVVMIIAVNGGLTATEILSRTQGSLVWMLFYGGFVIAVSIHAAIGVRVIAYEWFGLNGRWLSVFTWTVGALLLFTGLQAVHAVTATPL